MDDIIEAIRRDVLNFKGLRAHIAANIIFWKAHVINRILV
jgi:hypothetical protein